MRVARMLAAALLAVAASMVHGHTFNRTMATTCRDEGMRIMSMNANSGNSAISKADECTVEIGSDVVGNTDINIGIASGSLTIGSLVYSSDPNTTTLIIQPGNLSATFDAASTTTRPQLVFASESEGFTGLVNLSSLSLMGMDFSLPNVTLSLPDAISYIKLASTNAVDLSFKVEDFSKLDQIDLESNAFTTLPQFFYERKYSEQFEIKSDIEVQSLSALELNDTDYANLEANADHIQVSSGLLSKSLALKGPCDGSSSGTSNSGGLSVCNTGVTSLSSTESSSSSPFADIAPTDGSPSSASSGSTGSEKNEDDGGNRTLIVIIVVVVVVIAILVGFILRMYFKRRASSSGTCDETAVNLMSKGDTLGEKGSFISSDEFLRDFRLPQSEVSLVKSVGTGRLWVGEYNGGKVMVKRVEAEVTDSFVTKALMSQAHTFATLSHPSITSLVGVTWLAGTDFAVVTEFMDKGNLKTVLANKDIKLDLGAKLQMCLDVALALAYLHASEQNLCVKQLSSRKVLVNSALTCKLNLFECVPSSPKLGGPTAQSTFSYGMGEVAWLAPEVITRSAPMDPRKSNIFAFGVLMSEIFTRSSPYETLVEENGNTLSDVELVRRVHAQEALAPHENRREFLEAPLSLRNAMDQCLSHSPMSRPSVTDLLASLQAAKEELPTPPSSI